MRIGRHTNAISCEYDMQGALQQYLEELEAKRSERILQSRRVKRGRSPDWEPILAMGREVYIKEIKRTADFLLLSGSRLVGIEAKCNDMAKLLDQIKDHSTYCDYNFAYIPDYCLTPTYFKETLLKNGWGLIVYSYRNKVVTEVLEAHKNHDISMEIRRSAIIKLKEVSIFKTV